MLDGLWSGEKSICFFVSGAKCYWVLDYKYNFSLDAETIAHIWIKGI